MVFGFLGLKRALMGGSGSNLGVGSFLLELAWLWGLGSVMGDGAVRLVYDYTERELRLAQLALQGLNARLAAVLAGAGVLARLGGDVSLVWLRIAICGTAGAAIVAVLWGLRAQGVGCNVSPRSLAYEKESSHWPGHEEVWLQKYIARAWIETLDEVGYLRERRAFWLNVAALSLGIAGLLFVGAMALGLG